MKKVLNIALLITFILTILVPLTGVHIHKLASVLFLLLGIVHTIIYRGKLGWKRYLLVTMVVISFVSGIIGMFNPFVLTLHRVISIAVVFFMAIHIFVYHKRLFRK